MSVEYVCMARKVKAGLNLSMQRPRRWVTVFRTRDQAVGRLLAKRGVVVRGEQA